MGLALQSPGRFEESEELLNLALKIRRQRLGADHPDTATTINNLALLCFQLEKYEAAAEGFEQALSVYIGLVGAEHAICHQIRDNRTWPASAWPRFRNAWSQPMAKFRRENLTLVRGGVAS